MPFNVTVIRVKGLRSGNWKLENKIVKTADKNINVSIGEFSRFQFFLSSLKAILSLYAFSLLLSCTGNHASEIIRIGDEVYIADQKGKRWDISHAVKEYNMVPGRFYFGIGKDAIPPENSPTVFREGETGYLASNSNTGVFGVTVGIEPRAYNLSAMSRHEIFNDKIDGEPYIVAY